MVSHSPPDLAQRDVREQQVYDAWEGGVEERAFLERQFRAAQVSFAHDRGMASGKVGLYGAPGHFSPNRPQGFGARGVSPQALSAAISAIRQARGLYNVLARRALPLVRPDVRLGDGKAPEPPYGADFRAFDALCAKAEGGDKTALAKLAEYVDGVALVTYSTQVLGGSHQVAATICGRGLPVDLWTTDGALQEGLLAFWRAARVGGIAAQKWANELAARMLGTAPGLSESVTGAGALSVDFTRGLPDWPDSVPGEQGEPDVREARLDFCGEIRCQRVWAEG